MINFNVHIGYVQCANRGDGKTYKPFMLDLSKFPSLFIDYGNKIDRTADIDELSRYIMYKCSQFEPEDRVKCVVIDGFSVTYNSIMQPGKYKRSARITMIKRLNTYVSKIYEEYLKNPDDFIPRTKYIILVCRIGGMEEELISIMSKLGPIGVYLIMADDMSEYLTCPELFKNLYGSLTYVDFYSLERNPAIKYDPDKNVDWAYTDLKFVYALHRLRLQSEDYPTIYPQHYCKDFPKRICSIRQPKIKKDLPTYSDNSIF